MLNFRSRFLSLFLPVLLLTAFTQGADAQTANFGTVTIGQTSASMSLTFTFSASVTIGSPVALTMGATGQDFAVINGGTCSAGSSFSSGGTCKVVPSLRHWR